MKCKDKKPNHSKLFIYLYQSHATNVQSLQEMLMVFSGCIRTCLTWMLYWMAHILKDTRCILNTHCCSTIIHIISTSDDTGVFINKSLKEKRKRENQLDTNLVTIIDMWLVYHKQSSTQEKYPANVFWLASGMCWSFIMLKSNVLKNRHRNIIQHVC